ncbi:TolC family outer membrane protein [Sphingomonas sp. PB2P19]|uniref:TolC family outer membrane protein n=1 Tax=Sphingomonas rhamnosi TaxID=3096156 RepID=UPI002FC917EA
MNKYGRLLTGVTLLSCALPSLAKRPSVPAMVPQVPMAVPPVADGEETLGVAIADAYRANPELEAQRAQLRAQDEQVIQAASPYRLNANLVGNFNYREQRQRDFFGDFVPTNARSMGASISASQILLNGGRTAAQVSAAEANVLSARERLREVENLILQEVVDSYVSVRRDTEIVTIQQQSVDSYLRQVRQAEARERGGDLTRTDIAQAQAQLDLVRAQLAQAQANLQSSRARFAAVVGRNPKRLAAEPPLPGLPISLDSAYAVADKESPALWQAILNERSAKAQIAASRAERAPVLSINGAFGYNSPTSYQTRDMGRNIVGGATLTIPLLSAGLIGSRVRTAIATQQQQEFLIEATRRNVQVNVQGAWNQSIASRDQLELGDSAVRAANSALEGVRRGFGEGFRSNFEVLDSEQRLLNSQILVANARYSRYSSQVRLLAVLGRLQASVIDQAVPVYDETANLRRTRARQFGPFQTILAPIDQLSKPSGMARKAPVLPSATDATVRPAEVAPPTGELGVTVPVSPLARPLLPDPTLKSFGQAKSEK